MENSLQYHLKKRHSLIRWRYLFGALVFVLACNFTRTPPTDIPFGPGNPSTAAALTVQAQLTKGAAIGEVTNTPPIETTGAATSEVGEASETPAPPPPSSCGNSLPTRLSTGSEATVVVFQVTLRTQPGLSADQVNFLARDRVVQVLQGPECVNGSWWWKVNNEELGYEGWVAEGDKDNYYLEP